MAQPSNPSIAIGVIGGSGLYQMDGLTETQELALDTPYGKPSDHLVAGRLDGAPVVFLARHARGHKLLPSEIPFLANMWALKSLGVKYLLSVSAVGSLAEEAAPRDLVLPDQFIDMTRLRARTFFGSGVIAHASLADPVCPTLRALVHDTAKTTGFGRGKVIDKGTYVCIEGPQFSTRAESHMYRSWNAKVIGMTNMPEARLAREAEIAYATLALVTDYDCWKEHEADVTAEMAIATMMENVGNAQNLVRAVIKRLHHTPPVSAAHDALKSALITPVAAMDDAAKARLAPLLKRYL
ncbi:MAG: S-methyl-5-thioadenosine phosphorylase [Pseudomonadota bacterium]|jgi:5'-methylthioadenosine phosphorylase